MGEVTILKETTKNPITLIGERAGICWGASIADPSKNYNRGMDCIISGHGRTLEFVDVHMVIDGYSARVIREYTRHVGGLTPWLQASTRYIDYVGDQFKYIIPGKIKENELALKEYCNLMENINATCKKLETEYSIPREDIANMLPLGMTTKTVEKRNLRNLIDMAHTRKCNRAYWEFRELFSDIENALADYSEEWFELIRSVGGLFVPKCDVYGYCNEKKSCGRHNKK